MHEYEQTSKANAMVYSVGLLFVGIKKVKAGNANPAPLEEGM